MKELEQRDLRDLLVSLVGEDATTTCTKVVQQVSSRLRAVLETVKV